MNRGERSTQLPEHLNIEKQYARFSPQGHVTLEEGAKLVGGAIEFCREQSQWLTTWDCGAT